MRSLEPIEENIVVRYWRSLTILPSDLFSLRSETMERIAEVASAVSEVMVSG